MLVAIDFPDDFFIAGFRRVEFVKLFPVFQRQVLAGNRFVMPINRRPEIEIQITEQIEFAVNDFFGFFEDVGNRFSLEFAAKNFGRRIRISE